jgi:hypothetical protein
MELEMSQIDLNVPETPAKNDKVNENTCWRVLQNNRLPQNEYQDHLLRPHIHRIDSPREDNSELRTDLSSNSFFMSTMYIFHILRFPRLDQECLESFNLFTMIDDFPTSDSKNPTAKQSSKRKRR